MPQHSPTRADAASAGAERALWAGALSSAVCFAVWTLFSIVGIRLKAELGLGETAFGVLLGTPVLSGSISRLLLGIWADRRGGRWIIPLVMVLAAAAAFLLSRATTYPMLLLAGLGIGIAGGAFAASVAYVAAWFPPERQGRALGILGAGNIGAAVTHLLAPPILIAHGWTMVAQLWAAALVLAALFFLIVGRSDPRRRRHAEAGRRPRGLAPLRHQQVWRFSLYSFCVFGSFVALALWLPRYLMGVYGLDLGTAGIVASAFSLPAALLRPYGTRLVERHGARRIMYWTFGVSLVCLFMLSYPPTTYIIQGTGGPITFSTSLSLVPFAVVLVVLGGVIALGNAAIARHIPAYYPDNAGAVSGLVGMIGGLGGFVLPIVFGIAVELSGVWTSCFALLFLLVAFALVWMHLAIRAIGHEGVPAGAHAEDLPEMQDLRAEPRHGHVLEDWRPEDEEFWQREGRRVARRNLWISIPCLLLAFSVWMVWSVVVAKLPAVGFGFTTDQLFWLAAAPGISGATLRIFYSFMVPVFGGRLWTSLTTASLLIPAFGIGYAVQDPTTPYLIFLVLALLCGFGGGNFASSMANISFFYPRGEKGNALALNAGLGNLGVSVMQFLVPLVVTTGVFGTLGGGPQVVSETGRLWLQNAGFVWVPFLIVSTLAAWIGMDDIASARASFSEQATIFERKHNWIMCWLYTGTFGSFIGYSAGFPLLARTAFPHIDSLQFVFLGPLVGALSRAGTGWVADRWGGGRVTLCVFVAMMVAVIGVLCALWSGSFLGFFAMFMLLFFFTGVGNASTFQMIPVIMRQEIERLMPEATADARHRAAERESAAIIGFTSAIAAYGAFFIPKAFGSSIAMTGTADASLWGFLVFYATCVAATFWFYVRRGAPTPA